MSCWRCRSASRRPSCLSATIWMRHCKLGDQISILEGGRIVQTGTAEDIVMAPAKDYVAEFVRHMNPLIVLTGSMVMRAAASFR